MTTKRVGAFGALITVLALITSACGGSTTSSPANAGAEGAGNVDAQASLAAAYEGIAGKPPTQSVPAEPGVKAWVVSCGQMLSTCSVPSDAIVEAGETIGWDTTICDGKLAPEGWSACIRQGVAEKAQVIFVIGQDCSSFVGPLQEARSAGITTIGVGANDCDVSGGEKLFSAITQRYENMTNEQWWNELGKLQANWLIGKTDGNLKLLEVKMEDARFGPWISEGLEAELKKCATCEVTSAVTLTNLDSASGALGQKFSSALLGAPTANAVAVPLDPWFLVGLSQAIQSSGRADGLAVIGAFGQEANTDLVRGGQAQDATAAFDQVWEGWSGVDTALRVLAKQPVLPAGIGIQVVDADNNLPAAGSTFTYVPEVDFKSLYGAVWTQK